MAYPEDVAFDEILLELSADDRGAMTAHADEAHTAVTKTLNDRDGDVLLKALRADVRLTQGEQHFAAHEFIPRLAAARASRALE